jgi:hypothetical protein
MNFLATAGANILRTAGASLLGKAVTSGVDYLVDKIPSGAKNLLSSVGSYASQILPKSADTYFSNIGSFVDKRLGKYANIPVGDHASVGGALVAGLGRGYDRLMNRTPATTTTPSIESANTNV